MATKFKKQSDEEILEGLRKLNKKIRMTELMSLQVRYETYIRANGQKTYIEDLLESEFDFLTIINKVFEDSKTIVTDVDGLSLGLKTGATEYYVRRAVQTLLKQASGKVPQAKPDAPKSFFSRVAQIGNKVSSKIAGAVSTSKEDLFFRVIHQNDLVEEFEADSYFSQFSIEFQKKYNKWKIENGIFIASCKELHQDESNKPNNQLKTEPQQAEATTLEDFTKSELEYRLMEYARRRDSASNVNQQQFYNVLAGLTEAKLYPEKFVVRPWGEHEAAVGLIQFLRGSRSSFSEQSLIDAQSVIREVLFPLNSPTSYFIVNDETYDAIEPDTLFRVAYLYGVHEFLDNRIDDLPSKFSNSYAQWMVKNSDFVEECLTNQLANNLDRLGEVQQKTSLPSAVVPQEFIDLSASQNEIVRQLYQGLVKSFAIPTMTNARQKELATREAYPEIIAAALAGYKDFEDETRKDVREFLMSKIFFFSNPAIMNVVNAFQPDQRRKEAYQLMRTEIEVYCAAIPHNDLFKVAYLYGQQDALNAEIKRKSLPPVVRKSYDAWKTANAEFIASCVVRPAEKEAPAAAKEKNDIPPIDLDSLDPRSSDSWGVLATSHPNPHVRNFYTLLSSSSAIAASDGNVKSLAENNIKICDVVASNYQAFEGAYRETVRDHFINEFERQDQNMKGPSEIQKRIFKNINPAQLFKAVHLYDVVKEFEEGCSNGVIPIAIRQAYKNWKGIKKNALFIDDCRERNYPAPVQQNEPQSTDTSPVLDEVKPLIAANDDVPPPAEPSSLDAVVRHHEVHHPIVVRRNREEGMGVRPVDEADRVDAAVSDTDKDQQRTKKLSDALKINSSATIEAIDVFWNVGKEVQNDGKPYNLISIKLRNGTITNIAVCDFVGNMTLVERNASQYDKAATLDREEMRKKPTTWTVVHFNDDQWIEGVKQILYADLNDLSPALKSRSYWYSLSDVSVQTLTTKFMIAGKAPATGLTPNLIDCGPLEGRSKYNLLYAAWNRGSIEGWMKGTTFTLVLDALVNGRVTNAIRIEQGKYVFNEGEIAQRETPSMPWLKKFENKPQITSDSIIQASERFRREFGEAVDREFFEFLLIDAVDARADMSAPDLRRTGIEADMAFKFKAVAIPEKQIEEWGRYPYGLEDFLELSGVTQSLPERSVA